MPGVNMRRFVVYWLPVLMCAAAILVGTSLPRAPGPEIEGGDKLAHLLAYGLLGLLLMRAYRSCEGLPCRRAAVMTMAVGGLYAALDELHQMPLPRRTASLSDFGADLAGLALGAAVVWLLVSARRDRREIGTHTLTTRKRDSMAEPLHVNDDTFESEVLQSELPALVDFWAPWCGPCLMMGPTIEKLAEEYDGRATIAKVNVDDSPGLATKYGIRSIPSLLFFKGGEVVDQLVGVQSEAVLKGKLDGLA